MPTATADSQHEAELGQALADLDALEALAEMSPSPPPPQLFALSTPSFFAPAFFEQDSSGRLLTFDEPELRDAFFSGFESDNIDEDEDMATPKDAIDQIGQRALANVDACFNYLKKQTAVRRSLAPTLRPTSAPATTMAVPATNGFRFT